MPIIFHLGLATSCFGDARWTLLRTAPPLLAHLLQPKLALPKVVSREALVLPHNARSYLPHLAFSIDGVHDRSGVFSNEARQPHDKCTEHVPQPAQVHNDQLTWSASADHSPVIHMVEIPARTLVSLQKAPPRGQSRLAVLAETGLPQAAMAR